MIPAPLERRPVADEAVPFLHQCYAHTASDATDATMVWGTQIDMSHMLQFLAHGSGETLLTPTAILARSVALALAKHPEANSRLLGQRVYRFNERNIVLPVLTRRGPAMHLLRQVDELSYAEVASQLKQEALDALDAAHERDLSARIARQIPHVLRGAGVRFLLWLTNHIRLPIRSLSKHLTGAPVLINYFGFPCAPPLIAYKPSRFGSRAILLNVTLGPTTRCPVVVHNEVLIRPMAGLFVRVDHRTMHAQQMSNFVRTLVEILEKPADFDRPSQAPSVAVSSY